MFPLDFCCDNNLGNENPARLVPAGLMNDD